MYYREIGELLKMELQNVDKHTGIGTWVCKDACRLMKSILASNWNNCHVCATNSECTYCESSVIWHQLCLQLVTYMAPENLAYPPDVSHKHFFLLLFSYLCFDRIEIILQFLIYPNLRRNLSWKIFL